MVLLLSPRHLPTHDPGCERVQRGIDSTPSDEHTKVETDLGLGVEDDGA